MSSIDSSLKNRTSRKILVKWSDEEVFDLIEAVRRNPVLWRGKSSYTECRGRVSEKRSAAWEKISSQTFKDEIPIIELMNKWQNLRCQFKEYSKKMNQRRNDENWDKNYLIRWKFFPKMGFIELKNEQDPLPDLKYEASEEERDEEREETLSSIRSSPNASYHKRQRLESEAESLHIQPEAEYQQLDESLCSIENEKDDAQIFADFIASSIREIPSKQKRQMLKREINRTLLAFQDAQC